MATKRKTVKHAKRAQHATTATVKSKKAATRSARGALAIATGVRKNVKQRVAAMAHMSAAVCKDDDNLQAILTVLRNGNEPVKVRLAALQSLQAASFSVIVFEPCRGDYIATLRKVATDADPELRQRVLGILAREKDGFAQKKLLDGLQHPEKALVAPEKALQLLSYDVHAEAYSAARAIVSKPPNDTARREALRLLAADATAAPLFEKLLRDKTERAEIRQISASALQALKPDKLQAHARAILLDTSEYDDIHATCLTALTQFGNAATVANDEVLWKGVDRLSNKASAKVKQSARRLLRKYGR